MKEPAGWEEEEEGLRGGMGRVKRWFEEDMSRGLEGHKISGRQCHIIAGHSKL